MMKRMLLLVLCLSLVLLVSITHGQSQSGSQTFQRFKIRLCAGESFVDEAGSFFNKPQVTPVVLSLPRAKGAWLIEVSRDGGMRPSKSSVSINSAGDISVTSEHSANGGPVIDCSLKERLAVKDLRALKQAIASAKPAAWEERYSDPKHPICCDQPTTSLTLEWRASDGSKKTYSTSWYPGSAKLRPADLVRIEELIEPVWDKTSEKCDKGK